MVYTWRNRTLRGLGFSLSVLNLGVGALNIAIPIIVLQRLHFSEAVVGIVIAVQGLTGIASAFFFGRMDSRNRERRMMIVTMTGMRIVSAPLLLRSDLVSLMLVMALTGLLTGPLDIALFTLRQRRTDPGWMGRAFAISMSFDALGQPIASAIAGYMAAQSIDATIAFGVLFGVISGAVAAAMIPSS